MPQVSFRRRETQNTLILLLSTASDMNYHHSDPHMTCTTGAPNIEGDDLDHGASASLLSSNYGRSSYGGTSHTSTPTVVQQGPKGAQEAMDVDEPSTPSDSPSTEGGSSAGNVTTQGSPLAWSSLVY